MNKRKFSVILSAQTAIAQKVFDLVPIAEAWPIPTIISEIGRRQVAVTRDHHTLAGVLASLVSVGLVKEVRRGFFQRVQIADGGSDEHADAPLPPPFRLDTEAEAAKPKPAAGSPTKLSQPVDTLTCLQAISARCIELSNSLRTLASDIETAALEINERHTLASKETEKLRHLQKLLRELQVDPIGGV